LCTLSVTFFDSKTRDPELSSKEKLTVLNLL